MTEYEWDPAEVVDSPGFGSPIAAYECDTCGTVVPVHFSRDTETPPDGLPTYPCGARWGGCEQTVSMTLVSDGFVA